MTVYPSIPEIRHAIQTIRAQPASGPVVFVPTMGALHEGHLSLVKIGREWGGPSATLVASIFVNPAQFAPHEDFDAYPRPMESDLEKCRAAGVDLVFAPDRASMYSADASVRLVEDSLSKFLCGASRPHFFGGVCTVVAKLFNIVQPDAAVFGEKDFQQLAIIRRMVRDLDFPVTILGGPIVREADGLAMSSRNQYLSEPERAQSVVLNQALSLAREAVKNGERDAAALKDLVSAHIQTAPEARIDYVEAVDPATLQPVSRVEGQLLIAMAVFFGKTRLIDNAHIQLA